MIAQFQTEDGAFWLVDTELQEWSVLNRAPNEDTAEVLQDGKLTPLGYGRFALTPRNQASPEPGKGLCTIGIMPVAHGTTLTICFSANVPIREFTMPEPINVIKYEIISAKASSKGPNEYVPAGPVVQPEPLAAEVVADALAAEAHEHEVGGEA